MATNHVTHIDDSFKYSPFLVLLSRMKTLSFIMQKQKRDGFHTFQNFLPLHPINKTMQRCLNAKIEFTVHQAHSKVNLALFALLSCNVAFIILLKNSH